MRRQDELTTLYPSSRPLTRKFILSQFEDLGLSYDSTDLFAFLNKATADGEGMVRHQAWLSLLGFLPGYVQKSYSMAAIVQSPWTVYSQDLASLDQPEPAARKSAATLARGGAFARKMQSLTDPILDQIVKLPTDLSTRVLLALSQFTSPGLQERLVRRLGSQEMRFETVLALAIAATSREDHQRVLKILQESGRRDPDLYLLVSALPGKLAAAFIAENHRQIGELGRANLAWSLPLIRDLDHGPILDLLEKSQEGWVQIYAFRAIESLALKDRAPLLDRAYRSAGNEFLRVQAVRAAGGLRCDLTRDLCQRALRDPSDMVKSQALESLVHLRVPADILLDAAGRLSTSDHLRTRTFAFLILGEVGRQDVMEDVLKLLFHDNPLPRLEGAFCLGYLRRGRAVEYLRTLIAHEPNPIVKLQAIKALTKHPLDLSLPILVAEFHKASGGMLRSIAGVLTQYGGEEAELVISTLRKEFDRTESGPHRMFICRILGALGTRSRDTSVMEVLRSKLVGEETSVTLGAIQGINLMGGRPAPETLATFRTLASSQDARVRIRAGMGQILMGDLDGLEPLTRALAGSDADSLMTTSESLFELGVLTFEDQLERRFPALERTLTDAVSAAAVPAGDQPATGSFEDSLRHRLDNRSRPARANPEVFEAPIVVSRSTRDATKVTPQLDVTQVSEPEPVAPAPAPAAVIEAGEAAKTWPALTPSVPRSAEPAVTLVQTSALPAAAPAAPGRPERPTARSRLTERVKIDTSALASHLAKQPMPTASGDDELVRQLRGMSHLIGDLSQRRTGLAAAAFALVFVTLMITGLPPSFTRLGGGSAALLTVEHAPPSWADPGSRVKLRRGDAIPQGTTIASGPRERVKILSAQGDQLTIDADSTVAFPRVATDSLELMLSGTSGALQCHLRSASSLTLRHGDLRVTGRQASFGLTSTNGQAVLEIENGQVEIEQGTNRRTVGPGKHEIVVKGGA